MSAKSSTVSLTTLCHRQEQLDSLLESLAKINPSIANSTSNHDQPDPCQIICHFNDGENIPAKLKQLCINESDVIKCLNLSNAGKGKSFSMNLICGKKVFESRAGAAGVTTDAKSILIKHPRLQNRCLLIFDVPGLIEASEEAVDRNRRVLQRALSEILPKSRTALTFIFGAGQGGRLTAEDCEAFTALSKYVTISPDNFVTVVNKFPYIENATDSLKLKQEFVAYMRTVLKTNAIETPTFIPNVPNEATRNNFLHPTTIRVAELFADALERAVNRSSVLTFDPKAQLELLRHKLLKEIEDQQQKMQQELQKIRADQAAEKRKMEQEERALQQRIAEARSKSCCFGAGQHVVVQSGEDNNEKKTLIENVVADDAVRCYDHKTESFVWSPVYFADIYDESSSMIEVTTKSGIILRATWDHFVRSSISDSNNKASWKPFGHLSSEDHLLYFSSQNQEPCCDQVEHVRFVTSPIRKCVVETIEGTIVVNDIVCSCYDSGVTAGRIESFDLLALYHIFGPNVTGSSWAKKYTSIVNYVLSPIRNILTQKNGAMFDQFSKNMIENGNTK